MQPAFPPTPVILRENAAILLADDLTGAADSAAPFAALGLATRIVTEQENAQERPARAVSYALDTRNLPAETAASRLSAALAGIPQPHPEILFLKIDSAGRGPIGANILTALKEGGCNWALVAPAFPAQGRTVREGILLVAAPGGGVPEVHTQIRLETLFPESAQPMLGRIPRGDAGDLAPRISAALESGRRILLCDAETENDPANLVCTARQVQRGRILWCGAAALARAVASSYFSSFPKQAHTLAPSHAGRRCLLFAGTPHPATSGQMEVVGMTGGVLRIDSATAPEAIPEDTRCIAVRVRCGETSDLFVEKICSLAQRYGGVSGLILTGGDTASMVLKALGTRSILLKGEIAIGIPWGILEGGMADGIRVITKSGGFGGRTALVNAINFLEQTG